MDNVGKNFHTRIEEPMNENEKSINITYISSILIQYHVVSVKF